MTHPLLASFLKQQHVVSTSIRVHGKQQWHMRLGRGGTAQHVERAVGATHVARIQPRETAGYVRLGTLHGGIVMSLRVGHCLHVHGVVSMESDCETPKLSMRAACFVPCHEDAGNGHRFVEFVLSIDLLDSVALSLGSPCAAGLSCLPSHHHHHHHFVLRLPRHDTDTPMRFYFCFHHHRQASSFKCTRDRGATDHDAWNTSERAHTPQM